VTAGGDTSASAEPPADNPHDDAHGRAIDRFAATRHADGDWSALPDDERAALSEVAGFWYGLDAVADDPAVMALRMEARSRLDDPVAADASRGSRWRMVAFGMMVASAVGAVGLGALDWNRVAPIAGTPAPEIARILSNGRGTPRELALADGSHITLDTQSRVRLIGWEKGERRVALDRGRAFFAVAHDVAHPFEVQAGGATVTDIGTRFEVSVIPGGATVSLVEGKVRLAMAQAGAPVDLRPGMRLTMQGDRWQVVDEDVARMAEWRSGMISVDDRPVGAVVAELNRYLAHPLVVRDAAAAAVRVSGVFRLDDPQGFLAALSAMGKGSLVEMAPPAAPKG
jgi:transmembrane sensor